VNGGRAAEKVGGEKKNLSPFQNGNNVSHFSAADMI
jgi:hypothetical protein